MPRNAGLYFEVLAQLSHAPRLSKNGKYDIASFVALLTNACRPANVCRFVVAVVVDALKSPSLLAFANIFKKLLKRKPSLADSNAPTSVMLEAVVAWIKASFFHAAPHFIDSGMGHTMRKVSPNCRLSDKATTRLRSSLQRIIANCLSFSAFTNAKTHAVLSSCAINIIRRISNYLQSSKRPSNQGFFGRHNGGVFTVLFSGGCPALTGTCCDYELLGKEIN